MIKSPRHCLTNPLRLVVALAVMTGAALPSAHAAPANRIASVYISQSFINNVLSQHAKSDFVHDLKLKLDPDQNRILVTGLLIVPVEELRAVNLDPKFGKFRFQLAVKLSTSQHGHLIIEFPLNQTYFYPANSKNSRLDRVIVPVQMLSIAIASARGYLSALSGDFDEFDRRTKKLEALGKALSRSIALEKNQDALDELKNQRESLRVQLAAIPLERKQIQNLSKQLSSVLGFTGEKELDLSSDLAARRNALVIKIKLSQLVPYLDGVDLGGVRIRHDKKDGGGENFLVLDADANSVLSIPTPAQSTSKPADRPPMKTAPDLVIRLNQTLFASNAAVGAEDQEMGSKVKNLKIELKDDGLHVSGSAHMLLVISVPFKTIVDFTSTGVDTFDMRVREMKVAGIDFDFLAKTILESLKHRLNHSLKGICHFKYVGEEGRSHALRVSIDPAKLVPAFPDLHLISVDVRAGEFLMKIGRP